MSKRMWLAGLLLLVASVTGNVYLASRMWRAEARAKRAEARSIEPVHQRVLLTDIDLLDLKLCARGPEQSSQAYDNPFHPLA